MKGSSTDPSEEVERLAAEIEAKPVLTKEAYFATYGFDVETVLARGQGLVLQPDEELRLLLSIYYVLPGTW